VHVLQGEREMARDNKTLGRFHLVGILPAPRGTPQIEVTFDIDANGIVNVSAKDKATAKEQSITITGSTRLSKDETDRMVADAQRFAEEDRKAKETAETRNRGDSLVYQTEKLLQDLGDKVPADQKATIENAIANVRAALNSDDLEQIKRASDDLQQASYKLSEIMYQQASAEAQPGGEPGQEGQTQQEEHTPPEDEVIEAEFKEE